MDPVQSGPDILYVGQALDFSNRFSSLKTFFEGPVAAAHL